MKLIVLTGPDGSGKSTLATLVVERLERKYGAGAAVKASIWDSLAENRLFATKSDIESYLGDLEGYTRTLFLFHAMSRSLELAARKRPALVVMEGYWYKYAVTEIGQGVASRDVFAAGAAFPEPALTICLDVDVATQAARKKITTRYERGADTKGPATDRFIAFQARLAPLWKDVELHVGGAWRHLSTQEEPDFIASRVVELIEEAMP